MDLSTDEVLAMVRELFPQQFQIAALTVANRRQAERIAELEAARESEPVSTGGGD